MWLQEEGKSTDSQRCPGAVLKQWVLASSPDISQPLPLLLSMSQESGNGTSNGLNTCLLIGTVPPMPRNACVLNSHMSLGGAISRTATEYDVTDHRDSAIARLQCSRATGKDRHGITESTTAEATRPGPGADSPGDFSARVNHSSTGREGER